MSFQLFLPTSAALSIGVVASGAVDPEAALTHLDLAGLSTRCDRT